MCRKSCVLANAHGFANHLVLLSIHHVTGGYGWLMNQGCILYPRLQGGVPQRVSHTSENAPLKEQSSLKALKQSLRHDRRSWALLFEAEQGPRSIALKPVGPEPSIIDLP